MGLRRQNQDQTGDPYRGAQQDVAIRVTGALWVVGPVLTLCFLAFYPPTAQIGELGWLVVVLSTGTSIALGYRALKLKIDLGWNQLYASSFSAVAQIALLQWLAGGGDAPYLQWLILPMVAVATQRTAVWVLPVLVAGTAAAFSPLLYSDLDLAATIAEMALLSAVALIVAVVMTTVRNHRAELRDEGDHAASLARLDRLTGLGNRRCFEEALEGSVESYNAQERPLSLLLCDVDNFKEINDTFGHPAGDDCLRSIAKAMSVDLAEPDQAFRWAGDEFAIVLHDTDSEGAKDAEVRVAQAISRCCERPDGKPITIGVGSAALRFDMSPEQLLAAADVVLLERKTARRRRQAGTGGDGSGTAPDDHRAAEDAPTPPVIVR